MNEETMRKHYEATPKDRLINILISARKEFDKLQNRNKECKREIERLNTIINEVEKCIKNKYYEAIDYQTKIRQSNLMQGDYPVSYYLEEQNEFFKKAFANTLKKLAEEPEELFDNDKLQKKYNNLLKEQIKLKQKLQQKENIIKEVRETLNTQLAFTSSYQLNYQSAMSIIEEAKSILDKENNNGKDHNIHRQVK